MAKLVFRRLGMRGKEGAGLQGKEGCALGDSWNEASLSPGEILDSSRFPAVFAAKNRSEEVRMKSSSGGMFHALAGHVIGKGGVVYGCAFDDELEAVHIRCTDMGQVERCMGSKYSQSKMGATISHVKEDLDAGRIVLFTGTPCQVDAVRKCCGGGS